MKINTKSWHYRLLEGMGVNIPRSLCPYFWKVVFMMFVIGIVISIFGLLFYTVGNKACMVLGLLIGINVVLAAIIKTILGLLIMATIIAIIVGALIGWDYGKAHIKMPYKEDSMVVNYIKAKKSKICPTLEFVDE